MLRKCSAMCAAMVALVALMLMPGGRASASSSQYLYVNAQVSSDVPTYIWANVYRYQGELGGDFYFGDLSGVNFVQGIPTVLSFSSPTQAHLEGFSIWNGQLGTFSIDFNGNTAVSWNIKVSGQTVWTSGISPAGGDAGMPYAWAGVYMLP